MMRIEMIWLALGASDLRGGIDALLGQVVRGFAQGAQVHHAYVFANRRADRLKVLVYDGVGMWLCTRRLQAGGFAWPREPVILARFVPSFPAARRPKARNLLSMPAQ